MENQPNEVVQEQQINSIEDLKQKVSEQVTEASKQQETAPAATQVVETPKFTPSFKYVAYDKEYEIPEMYRGLIKDEATQKEVAALFSKAQGIDMFMPKHQKLKEEYGTFKKTYEEESKQLAPVVNTYNSAIKYLEKGDFDSLFELLGLEEKPLQQ